MNLPLPHRYDRYRLIALILDHRKKRYPDLSQIRLEDITHLDQSTISRLLNPDFLGDKGKKNRKLNRTHLLALTRIGLMMDHYQASIMLWLSEGQDYQPWRVEELSSLQLEWPAPEDERASNVLGKDPWIAHLASIDFLEKTCLPEHKDESWFSVETELLQGNSPAHNLSLFRKLKTLESGAGQRMLVSKYPSSLLATDMNASKLIVEAPEDIKAQLREMLVDRQKIFKENLYKFGERAIHSVPSLMRFVREGFHHHINLEERRNRVRSLIKCLRDYPKFQVGLLDEIEPEVEIAIKSTREAVIRGTARELSNHPLTAVCGPSYMYWVDEVAILNFYLDFERLWAKLHDAGLTEKKRVISKLTAIVET